MFRPEKKADNSKAEAISYSMDNLVNGLSTYTDDQMYINDSEEEIQKCFHVD